MMHQRNLYHRKKRGGALISALFIMAIAAIMATALAVEEQLLIHEARLTINADNAYLALQNAEDFAKIAIQDYATAWSLGSPAPDFQIAPLKSPLKTLLLNGLTVSTTLESAQGKFNINDLVYLQNQQNFTTLLKIVMPTLPKETADAIAQSISFWMMTGKDDPYYATLNPPYRSAQNQFVSVSELRLVKGMTPMIYDAVAPYLTALPIEMPTPLAASKQSVITPIDINAASTPVLMAVNPGLNLMQAESMVDCRRAFGAFFSMQTFMKNCAIPSGISSLQHVGVQSQYYLVHAKTQANQTVLTMDSLMMTQITKENKLKVVMVWQSFE